MKSLKQKWVSERLWMNTGRIYSCRATLRSIASDKSTLPKEAAILLKAEALLSKIDLRNDEVRNMGFITTPQAAQKLSVCESTIRNLVRRGKLQSFRDYNGRLKFRLNDIEKLKAERERILVVERS